MNKKKVVILVVLTLTLAFACLVGVVFFNKTGRKDWYSLFVIFYFAVAVELVYIIILLIIGFVLRMRKKRDISNAIFTGAGLSALIFAILMISVDTYTKSEFKAWKLENEKNVINIAE